MYFIGGVIGGLLIIYVISILFEKFMIRHLVDSPKTGIPVSSALAVVLSTIIYGFGNANGGSWNPFPGAISYAVAGVVVAVARLITYNRRTETEDDQASVFH